jgi:Domain of unknown function (DUF5069)
MQLTGRRSDREIFCLRRKRPIRSDQQENMETTINQRSKTKVTRTSAADQSTKSDLAKLMLLTRDLRDGKEYPRSPRQTLAGYVLVARALDKCRAVLAGRQGEYHSNCPLDQRWLKFAEIDYDAFKSFVATGATDDEVAVWIEKNARKRSRAEVIAWNNKERDLRLSDLPVETQEYMEDYIAKFIPRNRVVYHWFDVYDLEEERI